MSKPRILLLDEETSPHIGYVWGKYEQNVIKYVSYSSIICIAWQWLGEKAVHVKCLADFPGYKPGDLDDNKITKLLHSLLDEADIVVAHNGDRFDIKVANAKFIQHKLKPPSPYQAIDTKKVAKAIGMFPSNTLDDLGAFLKEGEKVQTGGFDLWLGCMKGDLAAWNKMKSYNRGDIHLLRKVYLRLRPHAKHHPNMNLITGNARHCTVCDSSNMIRRGVQRTITGRKQVWQCKDCGHYASDKIVIDKHALRPFYK